MSIPSSQIDTWAKQGPVASSSTTYQSIRNALTAATSPIAGLVSEGTVKIDLQGSYAHDTNVYGDSDVDVIVRYGDTFHSNKADLPPYQYELHKQHYESASYDWEHIRRDVITALEKYYGADKVDKSGGKSLKVLPSSGRLRADVVPAIAYRAYGYFHAPDNHSRVDGISFKHAHTGARIINYPDQHYENAVAKHANTNDRYKGLVRVFKNMRSYLVDKGRLTKEEAPSYFLQGMVYNVPDDLFEADRANTTLEALRWLRNRSNPNSFMSQNEQHLLLGTTGDCWNPAAANKTIAELCFLWDNWGRV